jgi:hypothetical protein
MQADRKSELRKANNTMAARISYPHGVEHAHVEQCLKPVDDEGRVVPFFRPAPTPHAP